MARIKKKSVVPALRALGRPTWLQGLSPSDVYHIESLLDMQMNVNKLNKLSSAVPLSDADTPTFSIPFVRSTPDSSLDTQLSATNGASFASLPQSSNTAQPTTISFPPGALDMDEPFKLGQPAPLGVKLPTDKTLTNFIWKPYQRRMKTEFNWQDRRDIWRTNHWRSRVIQDAFTLLGLDVDRRKKNYLP